MLPQLAALEDPRRAPLAALYRDKVEPPQALLRLGAIHGGRAEPERMPREGFACAGEQTFPHPQDVPGLLGILFHRVHAELSTCASVGDDLLVAALGAYGVLAIHPFEDGNGRAAVDLAQYLLMVRWRESEPCLHLVGDAHRLIGQVLAPLDEPCDGESAEALIELREGLARRLAGADLTFLRSSPPFQVVARYFEAALAQ